jgi:predicted enzyme related to lactoylglutathione lyase
MVTWVEIPCTDLERIQTFYSTVFGWTVNSSSNPEVSLFSKGGTNGSFVKIEPENFLSPAIHSGSPDKRPVALRVTLNVESVDEALKEVEKAGGSLYL